MSDRITHAGPHGEVVTADEAVQFINYDDALGTSGFTGAGYPKALPIALANRGKELHAKGEEFAVDIYTGASIAPGYDDVMTGVDIIRYRMPYQGDPALRKSISSSKAKYQDTHLSHSTLYIEQSFLPIDAAIVEVIRVTEDGYLIPSSSVDNNVEWMGNTDKITIEINSWQSEELEDMHDVYHIQHLPNRAPIPINAPDDRTGTSYTDISLDDAVVVVGTNVPDRNSPFKPLDETSKAIAGHLLDFLEGRVRADRLAYDQYIIQSGVGNISNTVMAGLLDSKFENIRAYTEVIQDGIIDPVDIGEMTVASATSFSLSPEAAERMNNEAAHYHENTILRPQQISNHPEAIRRIGLIATNDMVEADIYGSVSSTRISGSHIMSDIGGSGDFIRNAFVSSFISSSLARDGVISIIVPFASHVDHTRHSAMIIITERGFADLHSPAPRGRVARMISVAYPEYQPLLEEYYERVLKTASDMSTPHDLRTTFDFHVNIAEKGSMKG